MAEHPAVKENIFFFSAWTEVNSISFDRVDIAIGTLAVDPSNLTECSALKHRGIWCQGIPLFMLESDKIILTIKILC